MLSVIVNSSSLRFFASILGLSQRVELLVFEPIFYLLLINSYLKSRDKSYFSIIAKSPPMLYIKIVFGHGNSRMSSQHMETRTCPLLLQLNFLNI